jgi:hypothetical protein
MAYTCNNEYHNRVFAHVQLRHEQLLTYYTTEYIYTSNRTNNYDISQHVHDKSTYKGEVTEHAQRRIRKAIHKLLLLSPSKSFFNTVTGKVETMTVNFITLTIPQGENSKDAKLAYQLLLAPWLRTMRRKYHLSSYIWKAERQANESIHYHITTNIFIPYYIIRDEWNYLLSKHGYLKEYTEKYGKDCPNSTDVHKVYKIKDIAAYLSKYISKNEKDKAPIEGKVWDCSLDIKHFKLPSIEIDSSIGRDLIKMLESGEHREIDLGHSTLIKQVKTGRTNTYSTKIKQLHYEFIQSHKQYILENEQSKQTKELHTLYDEDSTNSTYIGDNAGRSFISQGVVQDCDRKQTVNTIREMDTTTKRTGSNIELHQGQLFSILAQPFYRKDVRQSLIKEYLRSVNYS